MGDNENEAERQKEDEKDLELVRWLREIGLDRFARDVNDIRFAHRIMENRRWIDQYDFRQAVEEKLQESIEQRLVSMHAQLFDKAANYNNIVVTLGYAGFFAIWNFTQNEVHRWDNLVIGSMLGFSLLVFVFWTLRVSLANASAGRRIGGVFIKEIDDRESRVEALLEAEHKNSIEALRIQRWWIVAFVLSVGPGFLAGLMLLIILFCQTMGFEFTFFDVFRTVKELIQVE